MAQRTVVKPGTSLLESSDEDEKDNVGFGVKTEYAKKYDDWRAKEELQKREYQPKMTKDVKDKYGDDPQTDSSSESEDEVAEALTPAISRDFFKTLSILKSKDPRIYDKSQKFYHEETLVGSTPSQPGSSKTKPMFLKDYERKVILEEGGVVDESKDQKPARFQSQYDLEQEELKRKLSSLAHDDSNDEEDLLIKRDKTKEQLAEEDADYVAWLKNEGNAQEDVETQKTLKPLKDYWTDPDLEDGEKFLRDYILDRKYLDKDAKRIPSYKEIVQEHFSEEEEELDKADEFEHKYNFRFEEPDPEFIKRYPRTMDDSLRRKDDSRKLKRDEIKERKTSEKDRAKEEIKQLKSLKRREIVQKIEKLKSITGNDDLNMDEEDLEGDFDPETYDKLMHKVFDEEYYDDAEETEKPELSDESDVNENWAEEQRVTEHEDIDEDPDKPTTSTVNKAAYGEKADKRRRRTKVSEAVQKSKPAFDPSMH